MRVEHDAVGLCVASPEPRPARKGLLRRGGIGLAPGELLAGDAADQPGVAAELVVHPLEQAAGRPLGAPAASECPAVDTGGHQADDSWLHANPFEIIGGNLPFDIASR